MQIGALELEVLAINWNTSATGGNALATDGNMSAKGGNGLAIDGTVTAIKSAGAAIGWNIPATKSDSPAIVGKSMAALADAAAIGKSGLAAEKFQVARAGCPVRDFKTAVREKNGFARDAVCFHAAARRKRSATPDHSGKSGGVSMTIHSAPAASQRCSSA